MQEQSANVTVGRSGLDEELEMIRETVPPVRGGSRGTPMPTNGTSPTS